MRTNVAIDEAIDRARLGTEPVARGVVAPKPAPGERRARR
jgi:hypothetical protein